MVPRLWRNLCREVPWSSFLVQYEYGRLQSPYSPVHTAGFQCMLKVGDVLQRFKKLLCLETGRCETKSVFFFFFFYVLNCFSVIFWDVS